MPEPRQIDQIRPTSLGPNPFDISRLLSQMLPQGAQKALAGVGEFGGEVAKRLIPFSPVRQKVADLLKRLGDDPSLELLDALEPIAVVKGPIKAARLATMLRRSPPIQVGGKTSSAIDILNRFGRAPVSRSDLTDFIITAENLKPAALKALTDTDLTVVVQSGAARPFIAKAGEGAAGSGKLVNKLMVQDVTGEVLLPKLPKTSGIMLFHVTGRGKEIQKAGKLLAQKGQQAGGLGGGTISGVSFTSSPLKAVAIRRDLARTIRLAHGRDGTEAFIRYAKEDAKAARLDQGTTELLVDAARKLQAESPRSLSPEDLYRARYLRRREAIVKARTLPSLEIPRLRSLAQRQRDLLEDPVIIGTRASFLQADPDNVSILAISPRKIPKAPLPTRGVDVFQQETRILGDVPIQGAKFIR